MENLSGEDQIFAKEVAITGNKTRAAKKAYKIKNDGYARLKGHRQITKDNIVKAVDETKKSLAERISTDKLEQVLNEGLEANKIISANITYGDADEKTNDFIEVPDHAVRHKFLDTGLKIKGEYAPDKSITINIDTQSIDVTNPNVLEALKTINKARANGRTETI